MAGVRIGISGWTYGPWRGTFYPKGLRQAQELQFASRRVNSIEINGTFYALQAPKSYRAWYEATPGDFVFSVKAPRYITHMRRLREIDTPLANFFASGVLALREKLGPVLWQFPPNFKFEAEKFEQFLKLLPRDTEEAAKLARQHDGKIKGRAYLKVDERREIRHAVEVRHRSFEDPAYVEMLRRHRVANVVADTAGKWPYMEDVTADFVYVRLHGDEEIYVSGYTEEAIGEWAGKIREWRAGREPKGANKREQGRDVYVYFDNDVKVRAPVDAMGLARLLGVEEN